MDGHIHSIESMGLVDGPGIRSVIFFQGCNLRCSYCHNPDTWKLNDGNNMCVSDLIKKVNRFKPYFKNDGGVTISGGEPLLQKEFLIELLKGLKESGIHTCIDTAGVGQGDYEEILKYTDLVLYDVKHYTKEGYEEVTGMEMDETLKFLKAVEKNNVDLWIRHVVVPGITDSEEHIKGLKDYVSQIKNVKKVELLPYHVLGSNKYDVMGIKYKLEGVEPMDKDIAWKMQDKYFGDL